MKFKHQKDIKFTANGETTGWNAENIRKNKDGSPKTEAEFVKSCKDHPGINLNEAQVKELYALAHLPEDSAKDEVAKATPKK